MYKRQASFLTWAVAVNRSLAAEARIEKTQIRLADEVLRFHVPANSDSKEDQRVKREVRDEVLSYMEDNMTASPTVDEAKQWVQAHLDELEATAESVLVKMCIRDRFRPVKPDTPVVCILY